MPGSFRQIRCSAGLAKAFTVLVPIVFCCLIAQDASATQPNIVFIMADDLGVGEIQWYPTENDISEKTADSTDAIPTPSLFALAQGGVRFTNYHAAAPSCSPSRAAILTGRYPAEFGLRAVYSSPSGRGIPQGTPTIASLLKQQANYRTAHFGKWHLGGSFAKNLPPNYGFDESLVRYGDESNDGYLDTVFIHNGDIAGRSVIVPGEHSTKTITDKAIEFIENATADGRPYFLNMWYRGIHDPVDPPGNFPQVVEGGWANTWSVWPNDWADVVSGIPELAHLASLQNHSPTSNAKYRAMMIAQIAWLDYQIGRLIAAIDAADPSGNTLIVFTSDNGAPLRWYASVPGNGITPAAWSPNGNLRGEKRGVFEGGIRVPMIIRWPARNLTAGVTNSELTVGYDFLPTFLAIADIDVSDSDFVGSSFLESLLGAGSMPARTNPLVWEQKNFDSFWGNGTPVGGYDTYTTLDDEQNRYALIDQNLNRKLAADQNTTTKLVAPHLFDLSYIDISQNGETDALDLLPANVETQLQLEAVYRGWRQQVGKLPVAFSASLSTADTTAGCVDVGAENQVAVMEQNELLTFREGDFSFQVQLELDQLPAVTGATIAEHPGSWKMSIYPDTTPDTLMVRLDVIAKNPGLEHPGLPGDIITLESTQACAMPCEFNIGFTVLGIVFSESSIRLYIDGAAVDEFRGNGVATAPHFREVFASGTEAVLLGNDSGGQSAIRGRLIDPRFYSLNLTPDEVAVVMFEQAAAVCETNSCH